jgi:recombinational DNA repair protein (RecF pathway)
MTTQERLRREAVALRRIRPRMLAQGEYMDELLDRAADEMDAQAELFMRLAKEQNATETATSEHASEQSGDDWSDGI